MSSMEFLGALEAEKLTKQNWEQFCGTPGSINQTKSWLEVIECSKAKVLDLVVIVVALKCPALVKTLNLGFSFKVSQKEI